MQHLGRSDAVEDLHAKPIAETREDRRRQRLPCRHGTPDAREIEIRRLALIAEQHRVMGRHGKEQRRPVSLDDVVDLRRRNRSGPENGGRADCQRKVHAVPESVREKQLRDAEAAIVCCDAEHTPGVALGADRHVALQMDAGFRPAGAARRVQPERRGVLAGVCGLQLRRRALHERVEIDRATVSWPSRDDDVTHPWTVRYDTRNARVQRGADDHGGRARIAQHELVVVGGPQRVGGNRHRADFDRAEEREHHLRRVEHQQQHAFFGPDPELGAHRLACPIHMLVQACVRDAAILTLDRDRLPAAFGNVAIDEIRRRVEGIDGHHQPRTSETLHQELSLERSFQS